MQQIKLWKKLCLASVMVSSVAWASNTPPTTTLVAEDSSYSYTLTATDSDGDNLNWSVTAGETLPSWLSLEQEASVSSFASSGSTLFLTNKK